MLTIKYEKPILGEVCPCCGGRTIRLTRFVYSDSDAHAVYYAAFSNKHPKRFVSAIVSLGEWGEGSTPAERLAFAVRIRAAKSEYQVMVINAEDSLWHDADILGRMLDREEALTHPWLDEVFHITDHIIEEDRAVRDYLDGTGPKGTMRRRPPRRGR
jgi:hypothetical protein